jgi:hypothetical protein
MGEWRHWIGPAYCLIQTVIIIGVYHSIFHKKEVVEGGRWKVEGGGG